MTPVLRAQECQVTAGSRRQHRGRFARQGSSTGSAFSHRVARARYSHLPLQTCCCSRPGVKAVADATDAPDVAARVCAQVVVLDRRTCGTVLRCLLAIAGSSFDGSAHAQMRDESTNCEPAAARLPSGSAPQGVVGSARSPSAAFALPDLFPVRLKVSILRQTTGQRRAGLSPAASVCACAVRRTRLL